MRGRNPFASLCAGLVLLGAISVPALGQVQGQVEFTKIVVDKTFRA